MGCLLVLTLLLVLATGAALPLQAWVIRLVAPLDGFLDRLGHDPCALAEASECPPL